MIDDKLAESKMRKAFEMHEAERLFHEHFRKLHDFLLERGYPRVFTKDCMDKAVSIMEAMLKDREDFLRCSDELDNM